MLVVAYLLLPFNFITNIAVVVLVAYEKKRKERKE
jgi:hypothetical protein